MEKETCLSEMDILVRDITGNLGGDVTFALSRFVALGVVTFPSRLSFFLRMEGVSGKFSESTRCVTQTRATRTPEMRGRVPRPVLKGFIFKI